MSLRVKEWFAMVGGYLLTGAKIAVQAENLMPNLIAEGVGEVVEKGVSFVRDKLKEHTLYRDTEARFEVLAETYGEGWLKEVFEEICAEETGKKRGKPVNGKDYYEFVFGSMEGLNEKSISNFSAYKKLSPEDQKTFIAVILEFKKWLCDNCLRSMNHREKMFIEIVSQKIVNNLRGEIQDIAQLRAEVKGAFYGDGSSVQVYVRQCPNCKATGEFLGYNDKNGEIYCSSCNTTFYEGGKQTKIARMVCRKLEAESKSIENHLRAIEKTVRKLDKKTTLGIIVGLVILAVALLILCAVDVIRSNVGDLSSQVEAMALGNSSVEGVEDSSAETESSSSSINDKDTDSESSQENETSTDTGVQTPEPEKDSSSVTEQDSVLKEEEKIFYRIKYVLNEGTLNGDSYTKSYCKGDEIVLPKPERAHYEFDGWYEDVGLSVEADEIELSRNARDVVLYAKWEKETYTITFRSAIPNVEDLVQNVEYGKLFEIPSLVEKTKYTFLGWTCGEKKYSAGDCIVAKDDMTFDAIWAPVYQVAFTESKGVADTGYWGLEQGIYDELDLSSISEFLTEEYELVFQITVQFTGVIQGYAQVYLYNAKPSIMDENITLEKAKALGLINYNTLDDGSKGWGYDGSYFNQTKHEKTLEWVANGDQCREKMWLFYDSYGNDDDLWVKNLVQVSVSVRKKA